MGNLPWEVNRRIVTDFLFHKFIVRFRDLFRFRMWKSNTKYKFYTYDDQVFSEFILNYLQRLSPRYIEKGERLFLEQEEVDEIYAALHGQVIQVGTDHFAVTVHNDLQDATGKWCSMRLTSMPV